MAWTVSNGVQVVGNPWAAAAYGPLPDPTDSAQVPPARQLRVLTAFGSTDAQLAQWQTWFSDAISVGKIPIPYTTIPDTGAANSGWTDAMWTAWVQRWVTALTAAGVKIFECGNEPTQAKANTYWARFKLASTIVRAGGGWPLLASHGANWGATQTDPTKPDPGDTAFLQAAGAAGVFPYADGVVIHPYAEGPLLADHSPAPASSCLVQVQGARSVLNGISAYAAQLPIYITEVGWGTSPPSDRLVGAGTLSEREGWQAQRLTEAFDSLQAGAAANKIRSIGWFTLRDLVPVTPDEKFQHCGLKNANASGVPTTNKPSWDSMVAQGAGVLDFNVPTVNTGTVTGPQGATATVPATINPRGRTTYYWMQYGLTTGYGRVSAVSPTPLTGSSLQSVTRDLTGLSAGIWHYRVVATNESGTSYGSDQTLSVVQVVPVPDGSAGSGLGAITETYNLTGLQDDTDYQFRVVATNAHGSSVGNWVQFHTLQNIVLPTAQTGVATNVNVAGATINGSVSANGTTGTQYWFEWGTTTAYGNTTTPVPISGNVLTPVSFHLTGLTPNTQYHFRVVAQNADGAVSGGDAAFGFTPPAFEPPELFTPSLLPINLSVEVQTADGRIFRWDADDQDPTKRPQDIRFSTAEGDGFADASCTLSRAVGLDWPDLNLLQTGRFVGAQGFIAYEGRVTATPRSVGDAGETFEVDFSGWMSSSRDRPFTEVYVDRSGDNWQEPSLALRKRILAANYPLGADYSHTVDSGSITFKGIKNAATGGTKNIPVGSQSVAVYYAPSGTKVSSFGYLASQANVGNMEGPILHGTDNEDRAITSAALAPWEEHISLTADGTVRNAPFATPRSVALLRAEQTTENAPTAMFSRHFEKIAVYGSNSVVTRANGTDPDGVYASDVFKDIVGRFCPQLDASQIAATSTVIPHLVFDTPTAPFDALTLLNGYHAYLLNAWENGVIQWEPADLTEPDWIVRKGEPGVQLDLHGESTDEFANGIVVTYTDINQRAQVLYPDQFSQLRDDDPDNQANKAGIQLWTTLDISVPVDQNGALVLGTTALAEFNRPKWPGTVSIASGYVADINENPQPAYRVRCGQTLSIVNLPNDDPRLITATDYSESGELTITLEQPPTRLDAVLARIEVGADLPFNPPNSRGGGRRTRGIAGHMHD